MSSPIEHRHLQQVAAHLDGIDVGQLLREIGEASANSNAVDLFGLCMRAQRALGAQGSSRTTADESALLAAFRVMDSDYRRSMLTVLESCAKRFHRQLPSLTLVQAEKT